MELRLEHPIKAAFCDMDGTLLASDHLASAATVAAIGRAQRSGITVSIATGRNYPMIVGTACDIGLKGPIITTNGAQLVDYSTGKMFYDNGLSPERLIPLFRELERLKVDYCTLGYDICMFSSPENPRSDFCRMTLDHAYALGCGVSKIEFFEGDFDRVLGRHPAKILVNDRIGGECERAKAALGSANPDLDIYYSSPILLEVTHRGVTKGTGVMKAAEYLGIEKQNVAVFGDFDNDLPMFPYAGLPVAMGNANDAVKAAAKYICEDNDSDGVALTLDRIIAENARLASEGITK